MRRKIGLVLMAVAAILFVLTIVNASWLAPKPTGAVRLIAQRGIGQIETGSGGDCPARGIEPPVHNYIENMTRSVAQASQAGADMVAIDVTPTADGRVALFRDAALDCRTGAAGATRSKTLAELQALDPAFGLSADGRTFPLRGRVKDRIPPVEEALATLPHSAALYHFTGTAAADADALDNALKAAKRDVTGRRDGFFGAKTPVERIRQLYPDAWAFTLEEARACAADYRLKGWLGIVPASCKGGTILVPLDRQWLLWGWPDRFLSRMAKAGTRVVITGPEHGDGPNGLLLPEQLGQIPSTYKGYVWVDDIWTVGPALRPGKEVRNQAQLDAAEAGLAKRRERLGVAAR